MDGRDTTRGAAEQRTEPHQLTEYVERALHAAVELELESASDGFWPAGDDERDKRRDGIVDAVHLRDRWLANEQTTADIARLADRAAEEQFPRDWPMPWPEPWPTTIEQADDLVTLADELAVRATVARDLLVVRDAALAVDCPRSTG
jgi:hypothetical protein